MKKWSVSLTAVVGEIGILFVTTGTAIAQGTGGTNLTTSPISTNLSGKPGSTVTTTLQVENNEPSPERIDVQLETFKADGTSGEAEVYPAPTNTDFTKWVHFSQTSFIAQPNIWVPVTMTISLPSYASLGYYYAVVFKPQVSTLKTSNQSIIKSGNAILVLLDAQTANAKPQLQLSSFTASRKLFEYLPVNFAVTIKNTGNIYLPPTGDIFISKDSSFKSNIETIPLNAAGGNVLPNSSREFDLTWSNGFPVFQPKTIAGQKIVDKNGKLTQQLQWNFSNANELRFGRYYAKLVMAYNNGSMDVPVVATLSYWVIPWKILSVAAILIVLLVIGLYTSGHRIADRTYQKLKPARRDKNK
jgi:hypothetical protein